MDFFVTDVCMGTDEGVNLIYDRSIFFHVNSTLPRSSGVNY